MKEVVLNLLPVIIIIAIITYVIKAILNKKGILKNNKFLKIGLSILSAFILYSIISFVFFSLLLKPNKTDFISDSWKEDSTIRYQMIDNLIDDKILIGKREIDIKNMLGEPTKVDSNGMWLYEIVGRTWADFTFISLIIEFKDSKVIDVEKVKT